MSTRIKVLGTWNLHITAPSELDFFLMLSSVSGVSGQRGQANYTAGMLFLPRPYVQVTDSAVTGNTFIDALAHHRHARDLPAMSMDVGLMSDVGYMARRSEMRESFKSIGFISLIGDDLLGILQATIGTREDTRHSTDPQLILGLPTGGYLAAEGLEPSYYLSDPRLARLKRIGATGHDNQDSGPSLLEQITKASSRASAIEIATEGLRARLAKRMMVEVEDVDASKSVSGYGVDSLTAVDLRIWCLKEMQAEISILDIMNNSSIADLAQTIVENSRLGLKNWED